jgi:hypothetical protein
MKMKLEIVQHFFSTGNKGLDGLYLCCINQVRSMVPLGWTHKLIEVKPELNGCKNLNNAAVIFKLQYLAENPYSFFIEAD